MPQRRVAAGARRTAAWKLSADDRHPGRAVVGGDVGCRQEQGHRQGWAPPCVRGPPTYLPTSRAWRLSGTRTAGAPTVLGQGDVDGLRQLDAGPPKGLRLWAAGGNGTLGQAHGRYAVPRQRAAWTGAGQQQRRRRRRRRQGFASTCQVYAAKDSFGRHTRYYYKFLGARLAGSALELFVEPGEEAPQPHCRLPLAALRWPPHTRPYPPPWSPQRGAPRRRCGWTSSGAT